MDAYRFVGWNTKPDGTGTNYSGESALDAIGGDESVDALTLYAQWECMVTLDANGGVLASSGVCSAEEQSLAGSARGSVYKNINQSPVSGLTGSKSGVTFIKWNTKPDGTGTDMENYSLADSGPVTFYAIYYKSLYEYTGSRQVFTVPVDGTYHVELYGAQSGGYNHAGLGGYICGDVHLSAGDMLYVYVGGAGRNNGAGGWNGGGTNYCNTSVKYGGGGATDIRLGNNDSMNGRIAVAGGAGSPDDEFHGGFGGPGGGLLGGYGGCNFIARSGVPGTQVSGYFYGKGQDVYADDRGSGGGGYFGGYAAADYYSGGGGGSSYMPGMPGCSMHYSGILFTNCYTQSGVRRGNGQASIVLVSIDKQ